MPKGVINEQKTCSNSNVHSHRGQHCHVWCLDQSERATQKWANVTYFLRRFIRRAAIGQIISVVESSVPWTKGPGWPPQTYPWSLRSIASLLNNYDRFWETLNVVFKKSAQVRWTRMVGISYFAQILMTYFGCFDVQHIFGRKYYHH